jgi:hypothetical protein
MMVKPATVNRIRQLSKQGKSSNEIARQLRREGIGIRRKTILAHVRKFKGRKPKAEPYKYTPRKYRMRKAKAIVAEYHRKEAERHYEYEVKPKHIAVYGRVDGISKRLEVSGTGKELQSVLLDAVEHPPKQRIQRVSADRLRSLSARAKYLDYKSEWDDRPTIRS